MFSSISQDPDLLIRNSRIVRETYRVLFCCVTHCMIYMYEKYLVSMVVGESCDIIISIFNLTQDHQCGFSKCQTYFLSFYQRKENRFWFFHIPFLLSVGQDLVWCWNQRYRFSIVFSRPKKSEDRILHFESVIAISVGVWIGKTLFETTVQTILNLILKFCSDYQVGWVKVSISCEKLTKNGIWMNIRNKKLVGKYFWNSLFTPRHLFR